MKLLQLYFAFLLIYQHGQTQKLAQKYDFIVVGAGSSGSVVANRLSEIPDWNVLLLEAGDRPDDLSKVPLLVSLLQLGKYNWNYQMEYQPGIAQGCKNNRMPWPKGRALGGTSVINYMIYTRGNRFAYDKWAQLGNPGWSYEEVLPFFKKSENASLAGADYNFHGTEGYLKVEDCYQFPISDAFVEGMEELGSPYIDYNSNRSLGVSRVHATVANGRRHSVTKAFLETAKGRPNLHIVTRAFVTKVLIDAPTREARGVEFVQFGKTFTVEATKEVILSAGSINSPQLLMLSGIGPRRHLQELGIPVLQDLQVGQNLQDHLSFIGLSFTTPFPVTIDFFGLLNPIVISEFVKRGSGPLTSIGGIQAIAYLKTDDSQTQDYPNLELLFDAGTLATDYGISIQQGMGIKDEYYNSIYAPLENKNSFMIFPLLLTPESRGYLKLRSKNPFDYPLLYGNYFTDPEGKDIGTFLKAVRIVQKLESTRGFQKFNATFNTNPVPGCTHLKYDSDGYWRCSLRALAQTLHHQIGTAKMGAKDDPGAVVNQELKVYGVKKLRVADCSVVPVSVGAHMNAPAIMIGEKAADLVKKEWGR